MYMEARGTCGGDYRVEIYTTPDENKIIPQLYFAVPI